jgi:type I restriction enzyme, S subunit
MKNGNELPSKWKVLLLEDIAEGKNAIVDGPFGSNLKTSDYILDRVNGVPVLTTKNLEGDYSDDKVRFISKVKFEQLKRSQVNPGDILVAKIGSIGKTGIYPKNGRTAIIPANLLKFTVSKTVNFAYVFFYLNSYGLQRKIKEIATATAQPAFNVTKFRKLPIPIPPIDEQERIVAKIEELFSELDAGVESLKKAQAQLKTYRQAVLKSAFEGKLTGAGLSDDKLTVEHKIVPIGEFVGCIVPNRDKPKSFTGNIPWLTTPDLDNDSISINYSKIKLGLTEGEAVLYNARVIPPNSVIMTCVGKFGVSAIVTKPTVANQQLHAFLPSKEFLPKYIAYNIKAQLSYFERSSTSTTIAYLNKGNCNGMPIRFCSIDEQTDIIQEIESRLSVCDKLEETIGASLKQSEALRQSILKQAFEGKLVAAGSIS